MYRSPAEFHMAMEDQPQEMKNTATPATGEYAANKSAAGKTAAAGAPLQVRYLMGVVVQVQDVRKATRALEDLGLPVIHLPSTGAFLGRRNVTMLVGLPENMQETILDVIHETCHQRVEYVSTPLEGAPMPIPLSTPITVGGATVFVMDIERYEEIQP
jgi:uncharacterized protein YaaQ